MLFEQNLEAFMSTRPNDVETISIPRLTWRIDICIAGGALPWIAQKLKHRPAKVHMLP